MEERISFKIDIGYNRTIEEMAEVIDYHRSLIDKLRENIEEISSYYYIEPVIEIGKVNDTAMPLASGRAKVGVVKPEI